MKDSVLFDLPSGFKLSLGTSFSEEWINLAENERVFFSPEYLHALELSEPDGFSFIYALILKRNVAVTAMYFQVIDLSHIKVGSVIHSEPYGKFMRLASDRIKSTLLGKKNKKHFMLVNGNMYASGNYALMNNGRDAEITRIYNDILKKVNQYVEANGDVSVTIIKDFPFANDFLEKELKGQGFIRFVMDPVMEIKIDSSWKEFDDYLQSLSSKYRLRAVNAIEKTSSFKILHLNEKDILKYKDPLDRIYQAVISKSPVRIVHSNINYIYQLKKQFGDDFKVNAWFNGDEPVAFFTAFTRNGITDAHHIGLDYHFNRQHALYQNILYALIRIAIESKSTKLDYGRTAMEMKSTVGAVPVDHAAYIKMSSRMLNHLIKPFLPTKSPDDWVQRDPFRKPQSEV